MRFSAAARSALELFFLGGAAARVFVGALAGFAVGDRGIGEGRGAAGFFFVGKLAQHHAARGGLARLAAGLAASALARRLFRRARRLLAAALPEPGAPRVRFFSTTTALVRPWLKLCLTVEVSVFFSDSVLPGAWFRRYRS